MDTKQSIKELKEKLESLEKEQDKQFEKQLKLSRDFDIVRYGLGLFKKNKRQVKTDRDVFEYLKKEENYKYLEDRIKHVFKVLKARIISERHVESEASKLSRKRWQQSKAGKEAQRRYAQSKKGKEAQKRSNRKNKKKKQIMKLLNDKGTKKILEDILSKN